MLSMDDRLEQALSAAYRYLNPRERTKAEVRAHLQGKGIEPRDVDRSIDILAEQGQLDDARFARLFIEDKRELEGWGSERIRRSLIGRGVGPELVERALVEEDPADDMDRALALLRRRFPSPPANRRDRERALGVLVRKGYDTGLALDVIADYANAPEELPEGVE